MLACAIYFHVEIRIFHRGIIRKDRAETTNHHLYHTIYSNNNQEMMVACRLGFLLSLFQILELVPQSHASIFLERSCFSSSLPIWAAVVIRGGGGRRYDDEFPEDEEHDRRRRMPPPNNRHGRPSRPPQQPQPSSSPMWSRLAKQSARVSGRALAATARVSGQAAHHLASPKQVDWQTDLVGLWRLDTWRNDRNQPQQVLVELTRQKTVVQLLVGNGGGMGRTERPSKRLSSHNKNNDNHDGNSANRGVPCEFRPASWPRAARLEFYGSEDDLWYTCTVHRKLADSSVIKLRGNIYQVNKGMFGGRGTKKWIGTFVGRRRLKLLAEDEDDEDDEDDYEEGYDEDDEEEDLDEEYQENAEDDGEEYEDDDDEYDPDEEDF